MGALSDGLKNALIPLLTPQQESEKQTYVPPSSNSDYKTDSNKPPDKPPNKSNKDDKIPPMWRVEDPYKPIKEAVLEAAYQLWLRWQNQKQIDLLWKIKLAQSLNLPLAKLEALFYLIRGETYGHRLDIKRDVKIGEGLMRLNAELTKAQRGYPNRLDGPLAQLGLKVADFDEHGRSTAIYIGTVADLLYAIAERAHKITLTAEEKAAGKNLQYKKEDFIVSMGFDMPLAILLTRKNFARIWESKIKDATKAVTPEKLAYAREYVDRDPFVKVELDKDINQIWQYQEDADGLLLQPPPPRDKVVPQIHMPEREPTRQKPIPQIHMPYEHEAVPQKPTPPPRPPRRRMDPRYGLPRPGHPSSSDFHLEPPPTKVEDISLTLPPGSSPLLGSSSGALPSGADGPINASYKLGGPGSPLLANAGPSAGPGPSPFIKTSATLGSGSPLLAASGTIMSDVGPIMAGLVSLAARANQAGHTAMHQFEASTGLRIPSDEDRARTREMLLATPDPHLMSRFSGDTSMLYRQPNQQNETTVTLAGDIKINAPDPNTNYTTPAQVREIINHCCPAKRPSLTG